jgi:hypothetical protein
MKRRNSRGRQYAIVKPDNRPRAPKDCVWCVGTGYVYVDLAGNQVLWLQHRDGAPMKKCTHGAPVQDRIPYRDFTEPQSDGS